MKAAIYLRVSTEEQSADNQLPYLLGLAERRGFEITKIYHEAESAWRRGHQKALRTLQADALGREFDVVLVWSLDRLTREGIGRTFTLLEYLWEQGICVISYQEQWLETDGVERDLLVAVMSYWAQWESDRRSERTLAGLARARREGKRLGRRPGSKDKAKRKTSGYRRRWANEQESKELRAKNR